MHENDISYHIRGAAFRVHNELGPGLLESVYEAALNYELEQEGFLVERQLPVPMTYRTLDLKVGFRLDLLVNEKVIVEIKSVEALMDVHHKQLLTYLRLSKKKLGLLINFNCSKLVDKESVVRIVNGL